MDAFNKMFLSKKNSENEYLNDNTKVIQSSIPHVSYSEEYVDFIKDYSICSLLPTDFINDQLELYYPADTCMPFSLHNRWLILASVTETSVSSPWSWLHN